MTSFNFDREFPSFSCSHKAFLDSLTGLKENLEAQIDGIKPRIDGLFLKKFGAIFNGQQYLTKDQREQIRALCIHTEGENGSQTVSIPPDSNKIMSVLDEIISRLNKLKSSLTTAYSSKLGLITNSETTN